uniref:RT_RNaseH_2 domain-containing protein n=1 Tax=Strongyloides stercoralis TaxID=6248 RepID=A0A0K0E083_STRER
MTDGRGSKKAVVILLKDKALAAVIEPPDLNREFIIHTDTSDTAISGVLLQENINDKRLRLIACVSRTLNETEEIANSRKRSTSTYQRALIAIKSAKENQTKLRRYQLTLLAYNFNIYYKKGKANVLADLFSRNPGCIQTPNVLAISLQDELHKTTLLEPPRINKNLFKLSKKEVDHLFDKYKDQVSHRDDAYIISIGGRERIYVSESNRNQLIQLYHTSPHIGGHFGSKRLQ